MSPNTANVKTSEGAFPLRCIEYWNTYYYVKLMGERENGWNRHNKLKEQLDYLLENEPRAGTVTNSLCIIVFFAPELVYWSVHFCFLCKRLKQTVDFSYFWWVWAGKYRWRPETQPDRSLRVMIPNMMRPPEQRCLAAVWSWDVKFDQSSRQELLPRVNPYSCGHVCPRLTLWEVKQIIR